jgi:uncharacterized protein (DUF2235 family)
MKRIILCADGTWNIRDQIDELTKKRRPSNVTKVARAIRARASNGIDQIVYYHDGVGAASGLDRFTGGAFGEGIEANIRDLYRFIVYNYEHDDELYFFGFSRGAFTVRTLAGFMNKLGLIQKDDDYYVPEFYACYEGSPEWAKAFHNVKDIRPCPPIRFIGVWDTVGALGAPGFLGQFVNKNKYRYHDIELNPNIQNAYQALAIDERRKPFQPNLWSRSQSWAGKLEQAWFPGVHRNVGGGYSPDGLANEALHWIVEKAEGLGLEFDSAYLEHFTPCFNSVLHDSMTATYRVLGDYIRPLGNHASDGEAIHKSAIDRRNLPECNYRSGNLEVFLARNKSAAPAITTRIPTGRPCPPAPSAMHSLAPHSHRQYRSD